ncbi:hypothetical protein B0H67DRAFT_565245 [Lasiosphaeris hirsuta]|uniref:Uncharacterized protein n=1 Tax=Lasiosphaeris hirsuta TaxID=260670 RepID=A0AA40BCF2_9PEZI|nr:hypothetical protein B0H67DRAFT_565245 [Lasiosphaeris hirsuta]
MGPNDHNLTTLPELTSSGEVYRDELGTWAKSRNLPRGGVAGSDGLEPEAQGAGFDYEEEGLRLQRHHQAPPEARAESRIRGRISIDSSPDSNEESVELLRSPLHGPDAMEAEKKMACGGETGTATIELRHQIQPGSLDSDMYKPLGCDTRGSVDFKVLPSPERVGFYRTLPLSHQRRESVSSTLTGHLRQSKFYSIDPGLADLASLVQHFDRAVGSASQGSIDTSLELPEQSPVVIAHESSDAEETYHASCLDKFGMLDLEKGDDEKICGELPRCRGHKRNLAVPKINTSQLTIMADLASAPAADRSGMPVFAAQPESPVDRLELQGSIPWLMKALPPLPSGSTRSDSYIANISTGDPNLPTRFSPFKFLTIAAPSSRKRGKIEPVFSNESRSAAVHVTDTPESTEEKKARMVPSSPCMRCARRESEEGDPLSRSDSGDEPRSPRSGNLKLKLKVSRGAISRMQAETILAKRQLTPESPVLLERFTGSSEFSSPVDRSQISIRADNDNYFGRKENSGTCEQENAFVASPSPCTPTAALPGRLGDQCLNRDPDVAPLTPLYSAHQATSLEIRSSFSDRSSASGQPARGLRRRISDLRIRLAEPRTRPAELPSPKAGEIGGPSTAEPASPHAPEAKPAESAEDLVAPKSHGGPDDAQPLQTRGFRGRVSRWMRAARHAVMVACTGSRKRG